MAAGDLRFVVGVAVIDDGRLLLARRVAPPELAGGYELPGGKVEPGESVFQTAVRELHEELGCDIEPLAELPNTYPLAPGWGLRVVIARLRPNSPAPQTGADHDDLWWADPSDPVDARLEGVLPLDVAPATDAVTTATALGLLNPVS